MGAPFCGPYLGATGAMDEKFLDSLYEAAVVPELWPQVLRRFQEIARGTGRRKLKGPARGRPQ